MKWIGQHIYDQISRFRSDIYLEDISTGTIASGAHLGLDSNNKIVKAADGGGDLTSIVAGTGLSGTDLTGPIPTLNVDVSDFMTNGVDNRVLTATGADAINAEAKLTFQDTTGGNMLSLDAATTTGNAFSISSDDLTYGTLINLDVNNTDVPLSFARLVNVDYDKTHVLETGEAAYIWGLNIDLQNSVNDNGSANVSMIGARIVVDSTGSGGILKQQGIVLEVAKDGNMDNTGEPAGHWTAGIDATVGNGAPDIVMRSSLSVHDYCKINTYQYGRTTITTRDANGSEADLELIADGDIKLSPTAGKVVEIDTSVIVDGPELKITDTTDTADYFKINTGTSGATSITTVDGGAHAADLKFTIDGNFWVDEADQIVLTTPGDIFTESTSFTSIIDDTFDIRSAAAQKPILSISSTSNDRFAGRLVFDKRRYPGTTADENFLGDIDFNGRATNNSNEVITFANIKAVIQQSDDGDEQGRLNLGVANNGILQSGLSLTGNQTTASQIDVDIAAGVASTTTIAGHLQVVGGDIVGTTDGDIRISSDNHITLNVDNDHDSSNQLVKFADNGTDYYTFNVAKCITEITGSNPAFTFVSTSDNSHGNHFAFQKQRIDSTTQIGEVGDDIGTIHWQGYNDGTPALKSFATMLGEIADPVTGAEAGNLYLQVASYDGTLRNGLQLLGDTNASGEVDVTIASGVASTTTVTGDLTVNGDTVTFQSANADDPHVVIKNTNNGTNEGARLDFNKLRADDGVEVGQNLGEIWFTGQDGAQNVQDYAYIVGEIDVGTHGQESGQIVMGVANHDGDVSTGLTLTGGSVNDEIDVIIGNGAASTTTVAGSLVVTGETISSPGRLRLVPAAGSDILFDGGISLDGDVIENIGTLKVNGAGGTIELGHASDTTIARSAAGVVTIEGDQIVTASVNKGKQVHINLRNNQNFLFYINTKSYWYSTSGYTYTYNTSGTAADFSMTYLRRARHAAYVAPYACKVKKIYLTAHYTTSYTTADLDFEWAMHKFTPGNNSNSSTTATLMTITDRDGILAENKNHTIVWDVTDNAASTLAPGDAFSFAARCPGVVSFSAQRQLWYGEAVAVVELI